MAEMTEPRELFMHELGDILYAERVLLKALPRLEKEASDPELAGSFKAHRTETEQHVTNLEKAFAELGEKAKAEKCPGIDGITEEHDQFVKEQSPSPEVLDAFLTGAGARAEHYEIAAYEGLISSAQAMGEDKVAKLLSENLAQEKDALQKMKTIGRRLARASARDAVRS
jgi:ferritin-like metal-binding protein YciE